MSKTQHDPLTVKRVSIGTDERTVFLEIPELKPVMQMSIKYQLRTAEGQDLRWGSGEHHPRPGAVRRYAPAFATVAGLPSCWTRYCFS